jgi:hypothetical protein
VQTTAAIITAAPHTVVIPAAMVHDAAEAIPLQQQKHLLYDDVCKNSIEIVFN